MEAQNNADDPIKVWDLTHLSPEEAEMIFDELSMFLTLPILMSGGELRYPPQSQESQDTDSQN